MICARLGPPAPTPGRFNPPTLLPESMLRFDELDSPSIFLIIILFCYLELYENVLTCLNKAIIS